jgi:hypothetical protein
LFVSKRTLQEQRSQPQKSVLGLSPGEDGFCSSATKKKGAKNKILCFGEEITETKVTNLKTVLGSSLGEDIGFKDNNNNNNNNNNNFCMLFNDTHRII